MTFRPSITFSRYAILEEGRFVRKTAAWVSDGERICGITVWKTDPDHTTGSVGDRPSPQPVVSTPMPVMPSLADIAKTALEVAAKYPPRGCRCVVCTLFDFPHHS